MPLSRASSVAIQDEGTLQSSIASTLNFAGAGVSASSSGGTTTLTIPGGGGGAGTEFISAGLYTAPLPIGGGTSDAAAFETWLATTPVGATIMFPAGVTYLQDTMVRYLPQRRYVWPGTDEPTTKWMVKDTTVMPAISGMWVPQVWDANSSTGQNPVEFIHPCLDGNKDATTGGHHGLIMGASHWYRIERPEIYDCRGDGIRLTNLAKDGTTVLGGDAADGDISVVRLVGNRGCGIRQVLSPSVNAHMDVQLRGGRIFDCGESGVLGDRLAGWDISFLHIFVIRHFAIRSMDGWFDLGIHHNQIEDWGLANLATDPYYNGTGTVSYAGISVKGYNAQACDISNNRVRITPATAAEPGTSGTLSGYIWVEGAGVPDAAAVVANNSVYGTDAGLSRSGACGIILHGSFNTLYVTGLDSNIIRNVYTPINRIGSVQDQSNLYVRKTADETVTSSTTLQDDNHLVLPIQANTTYEATCFVIYEGATTGDMTIGFSVPAGATFEWQSGGQNNANSTIQADLGTASTSKIVGASGTGAGNRAVAVIQGILITSTTAGNLQFRWAQGTSDVTATTVVTGSYMSLRRKIG